uniref:14-3-3 domain-containing protein n=1 Tax=Schistosoma japonicum TaxID=6182 RepID=C1L8E3_SCHJA|nr:conserved hypothetical protein [Schistosoma japonicum]
MVSDRECSVECAKLCEQAEWYDDMVKAVIEIVKISEGELTIEERNLLSVAYKNAVGARRSSWRILNSLETRENGKEQYNAQILTLFRNNVEKELDEICTSILDLLRDYLVPKAASDESKVFLHKMRGDYHRYRAEFAVNDKRKEAAESSLLAYKEAMKYAENLTVTHPIRLGLGLNFSVFYYEILNNPAKACDVAKTAFDLAIAELDTLSEESYKDSTLIMQLLRDNLNLWNPCNDGEKDTAASPKGEEK